MCKPTCSDPCEPLGLVERMNISPFRKYFLAAFEFTIAAFWNGMYRQQMKLAFWPWTP